MKSEKEKEEHDQEVINGNLISEKENASAENVNVDIKNLQENLEKIQKEKEELKDKYLRLSADFENYKNRTKKEKIDILTYGEKDFVLGILPILDDLERALKSIKDGEDREWLQLVISKFVKILSLHEVRKIETKIGDDYDEKIHFAIKKNTDDPSVNKITNIFEDGYYLKDKVIRFASVIV